MTAVLASGSRDRLSQNLASLSSSGSGFQLGGTDNRYMNNAAAHNSGAGIGIQPGSKNNLLQGDEATNNGRDGMLLNTSATANTIRANTAHGMGASTSPTSTPDAIATTGRRTVSAPPTRAASSRSSRWLRPAPGRGAAAIASAPFAVGTDSNLP